MNNTEKVNEEIFTDTHAAIAGEQGWAVAHCSGVDDEWRLERLDEADVFSSDYAAMLFVAKASTAGDETAQKAIEFLASVEAKDADYLRRLADKECLLLEVVFD